MTGFRYRRSEGWPVFMKSGAKGGIKRLLIYSPTRSTGTGTALGVN